jgi:cytochrome c556
MNKTLARLSLAACLLCTTLALAHEGATGVVKERMDLMKRQQNDLKLIGEMAKGKTPFDADKAAEAARDVGATAKKIHELFPEGSAVHPSDALPAIWTEWDRFTGNADALANTANGLAATLETPAGQDWKAGFQKLTDACKSCHQDFRAKKTEHGQH